MLRIKTAYAHPQMDGREAPIGVSIQREDGTRLVADLDIAEAMALAGELIASVGRLAEKAALREAKPLHWSEVVDSDAYEAQRKVHTVRGKAIGPEGSPYGVTHDMDCPGCEGTSFTASPRSETYWSS